MMKEIPNTIGWGLKTEDLVKKKYLEDLDFIKSNTTADYVIIGPCGGVHLQNLQQCHGVIKEITEYAHKIGLKINLKFVTSEGFHNAPVNVVDYPPAVDQVQLFPIPNPEKAEAIVSDIELVADEEGFAKYSHKAVWARGKIMPIFSRILKAFVFDKTDEGFYAEGSLQDVTEQIRITNARTNITEFEIDLGKENKGKNIFVLLAQYYNYTAVTEDWEKLKYLIDAYSDIPLDGITLDEYGYIYLNTKKIRLEEEPPFRGRIYSIGMKKYYEEELNIDLDRLLFDMRYAPANDEKVRIKAINTYFEKLRHFPLEVEKRVYDYAKKVFGDDIYMGVHNTFHNRLDIDEIWHTGCNWWDIPRDFGHTDEGMCFPVRWGVMLACKNPIMFDMYYSSEKENYYKHMIEAAPYNCREIHHAYGDFFWGCSFTEPDLLENVKKLDTEIARLNAFQTVYPKMDLLVIFGAAAQNNWYPDYTARNTWDVDGSLQILVKCAEMWNEGYRCALAPDYAIEDGRITLNGDKINFNGYDFTHCLFLYPKYAKAETYAFLNKAHANNAKIATIGCSGIDFNGNPVTLTAPHFEEFDMKILETIGCPKSAIDGGCVYSDDSFSLVSKGLMTNEVTNFDFEINKKRYSGHHTGLLAYRAGSYAFATNGSKLFVDGCEVTLNYEDELNK